MFGRGVRAYSVSLWVVLLCGAVLVPCGGRLAYGQGNPPIQLEFARFSPVAIFADGLDSMTLHVRVTGPVARVQALDLAARLRPDGQPGRFDLFDDGTRGDSRAGDQIFTRAGITCLDPGQVALRVMLLGTDGRETAIDVQSEAVAYVVPSSLRREVIRWGDALQTTPYLVNLRDEGQLFPVGASRRETPSFPDLRPIARKFYEYFGDDYDSLTVFTSVQTATGTFFHVDARNDVQGIGKPIFDNAAAYGSRGRLQGLNFMGMTAGALLHELMHQWGAFLNPSLELGDGSHWGAVNIPGFLFGIDFRDNRDGTYTITWTRFGGSGGLEESKDHRYPPMELYLMGLIPPEAVPEMTVLRGIDLNALRAGTVVRPTSTRKVTIQEVIATNGPRIPDVSRSPKQLRMASILITPGRLASAAEMAIYSRFMEHFASSEGGTMLNFGIARPSFGWATSGRAQMDTTLGSPRSLFPVALTLTPSTLAGCGTATGAVKLNGIAPPGGVRIPIESANPAATIPTNVLVPAGASSATFAISTTPVADVVSGTVTLGYGGVTLSQALTVRPIGVRSVELSPNPIAGGNIATATVTLECPAAPEPIAVTLSSDSPEVANPTVTRITIPAGAVSQTFSVSAAAVTRPSTATIAATANGISARRTLTVTP